MRYLLNVAYQRSLLADLNFRLERSRRAWAAAPTPPTPLPPRFTVEVRLLTHIDRRETLDLDPVFLSQLQFAFVIGYAAWLATIGARAWATGNRSTSACRRSRPAHHQPPRSRHLTQRMRPSEAPTTRRERDISRQDWVRGWEVGKMASPFECFAGKALRSRPRTRR